MEKKVREILIENGVLLTKEVEKYIANYIANLCCSFDDDLQFLAYCIEEDLIQLGLA